MLSGVMPSPFVFQQPLPPARLRGRDIVIDRLSEAAAAGNATVLAAPRRYGKTSVLLAVQERLAEAGHAVALVDLYATASLAELVVRLERAWARTRPAWRERIEQWLGSADLGLSVVGAGVGVEFQRRPRTDPLPALHHLLNVPRHLADERRAIVIFDEFQSLGDLAGAEGLLRSHIQHHRDVAGYIFAGSEPHLLERQFNEPDRPFYGQVLRERLDRPSRAVLAEVITDGFELTERHPGEALGVLLDLVDAHPQRAMLLAHFLWEATPLGAVSDLGTWQQALETARGHVDGEAQATYDQASRNQQRVLRAVALGLSPFTADTAAGLGLAAGSVGKAVELALRDGLLERVGDHLRLVDPLLRDWIRRRFP